MGDFASDANAKLGSVTAVTHPGAAGIDARADDDRASRRYVQQEAQMMIMAWEKKDWRLRRKISRRIPGQTFLEGARHVPLRAARLYKPITAPISWSAAKSLCSGKRSSQPRTSTNRSPFQRLYLYRYLYSYNPLDFLFEDLAQTCPLRITVLSPRALTFPRILFPLLPTNRRPPTHWIWTVC